MWAKTKGKNCCRLYQRLFCCFIAFVYPVFKVGYDKYVSCEQYFITDKFQQLQPYNSFIYDQTLIFLIIPQIKKKIKLFLLIVSSSKHDSFKRLRIMQNKKKNT